MSFALNEDAAEASLEEMSDAAVAAIELLCVLTVQVSHPARQIGQLRFGREVIVISHQAIGMKEPAELGDGLAQDAQENPAIGVIQKDVLLCISARRQMVQSAGEFQAKWSSHVANNAWHSPSMTVMR